MVDVAAAKAKAKVIAAGEAEVAADKIRTLRERAIEALDEPFVTGSSGLVDPAKVAGDLIAARDALNEAVHLIGVTVWPMATSGEAKAG